MAANVSLISSQQIKLAPTPPSSAVGLRNYGLVPLAMNVFINLSCLVHKELSTQTGVMKRKQANTKVNKQEEKDDHYGE